MQRYFLWVAGLLFTGFSAAAQARVEVIVTDVSDSRGTILVALFGDEVTFLKTPLKGQSAAAAPGQLKVVFEDLKPGDYAASIIHDANGNGKLDTNFIGIPREGFGFSNDAMGTFGPPSFEKAKFRVAGPVVIRIKAKYL